MSGGRHWTHWDIYNGVDPDRFRPLGAHRDPWEVLYVGSLHARKGIFELFRAIPLVLRRAPSSHFTLVGRLPPGGLQSPLVQQLIALIPADLRARVRFAGPLSHEDLPSWYSRAAALVVPSRSEAFGLVCVEAMACQTPVVMTSRACGPEIIEHEQTGLLADPLDSERFAAAIVRLLA
jgi:glycosyltransferase involved in cell wall biosynthesis